MGLLVSDKYQFINPVEEQLKLHLKTSHPQ